MMHLNFKKVSFLFLSLSSQINSKNIIILSIPKCGTHLLARTIELLTNKQLQKPEIYELHVLKDGLPKFDNKKNFIRSHLSYNRIFENQLIKEQYKAFFIYRDPRDQIVSEAYWIQRRMRDRKETILSIPELIDNLIENIDSYYNKFLPWKNSKAVCTIKFENLIGQRGGGNDILQRNEITKASQFLDIYSMQLIIHTINNLFGGTLTFREGQIGSWRKHFTQRQVKRLKEKAGKLLINLGYEKNLNW